MGTLSQEAPRRPPVHGTKSSQGESGGAFDTWLVGHLRLERLKLGGIHGDDKWIPLLDLFQMSPPELARMIKKLWHAWPSKSSSSPMAMI